MAINSFYSGDLAAITAGEIGAQDADTRAADSLRRYLSNLANTRAERDRTQAGRDINSRNADVTERLGLGGLDVDRDRISTTLEIAKMRDRLDRELGNRGLDVTSRGQDINERLGIAGINTQRDLGFDTNSVSRMNAGLNYALGNRRINTENNRTDVEREIALQTLANQKVLADVSAKAAIDQIREAAKFTQPNGRLAETIAQINAEDSIANTDSEAAAARMNAMIPGAIDSSIPWYAITPPGGGTYAKAFTPEGDPAFRSKVIERLMKDNPVDFALTLPTPTGFKPKLRGAAAGGGSAASTAAMLKTPIQRDRAMAAAAIEKASAYPKDQADVVTRNIMAEFKKKWNEDL